MASSETSDFSCAREMLEALQREIADIQVRRDHCDVRARRGFESLAQAMLAPLTM
jgi:hypothetical protein